MHSSQIEQRVHVRRVDECDTLDELIRHCFPAFGGAFLRRIYTILDSAIGMGCPLTLAISGPVTVSGQHQAWLIPLLETGWVAYLSTTDAVCYHDGHRSLNAHRDGPVFEVPIWGDDGALRDDGTIRVTDMAFDEEVLLDQDKFLSAVLLRPEFQRTMTGTELRYRLGEFYAEQERANGVDSRAALHLPSAGDSGVRGRARRWQRVSEFDEAVGHAAGGSGGVLQVRSGSARGSLRGLRVSSLGIVRQRAARAGDADSGRRRAEELQPAAGAGAGAGAGHCRMCGDINFDVQIVTAPVTDGSLSSCPPAEAVTWGKVDKDTYQQTTESMQADYSMVMPFLVKALLDNRKRYERGGGGDRRRGAV